MLDLLSLEQWGIEMMFKRGSYSSIQNILTLLFKGSILSVIICFFCPVLGITKYNNLDFYIIVIMFATLLYFLIRNLDKIWLIFTDENNLMNISIRYGDGYENYLEWYKDVLLEKKSIDDSIAKRLDEIELIKKGVYFGQFNGVSSITNDLSNNKGEIKVFEGYELDREEGELNYILRQLGNPITQMNIFRDYLQNRQYQRAVERIKEFIKVMESVKNFIKTATDLKYAQPIAELENRVRMAKLRAEEEEALQQINTAKIKGDADREGHKTKIVEYQTTQQNFRTDADKRLRDSTLEQVKPKTEVDKEKERTNKINELLKLIDQREKTLRAEVTDEDDIQYKLDEYKRMIGYYQYLK